MGSTLIGAYDSDVRVGQSRVMFAFEDLRARMLVPIHHGAFALSYEELDEPARWLIELAKARGVRDHIHVMSAGQSERFEASVRDKP